MPFEKKSVFSDTGMMCMRFFALWIFFLSENGLAILLKVPIAYLIDELALTALFILVMTKVAYQIGGALGKLV